MKTDSEILDEIEKIVEEADHYEDGWSELHDIEELLEQRNRKVNQNANK